MYTSIQLEAIRIFGRKDLTFGCLYNYDGRKGIFKVNGTSIISSLDKSKVKILGHELHLFPDVARVAEERGVHLVVNRFDIILCGKMDDVIPFDHTLPLIDQEETLKQLISLFVKTCS